MGATMILYLIRDPAQPLAKQLLTSARSALVAVLLNPAQPVPQAAHGVIYTVTSHEPNEKKHEISYANLFNLMFEAEKVIVV